GLVALAVATLTGRDADVGRVGVRLGRRRPRLPGWAAVAATVATGAVVLVDSTSAALDLAGLAALAAVVGWLVRQQRAEAVRRRRHQAVVGLCGALAA